MPLYKMSDLVQSKNEPNRYGPVLSVMEETGGLQYYQVLWPHPQGPTTVLEEDIVSYHPVASPYDELQQSRFSGYWDLLKIVSLQRLMKDQPLKNTIYAFNASRTRFYPYQFKPLIKFLDSEKYRVLICDEVGLGKTIEAGLILTEYRARFSVKRVLVVCPSNLREKWLRELKLRFDEDFQILNAPSFVQFLDAMEGDPGRTKLNGIVSLETVRSSRCLKRLEEVAPDLDLVIVDEAHHMRNFGRKQRRAGVLLSRGALAMVMLTATPVQLGVENLFSLLNILDEDDFPEKTGAQERFAMNEPVVLAQNCLARFPLRLDEAVEYLGKAKEFAPVRSNPYFSEAVDALEDLRSARDDESLEDDEARRRLLRAQGSLSALNLIGHIYTRTRRRQVNTNFTRRAAFPYEVSFTPLERAFYQRVTEYVRALCRENGHVSVIQKWILNMPQRRMASSIPAMVAFYRKKFGMSGYQHTYEEELEGLEDLDDLFEEDEEDEEEREPLSLPLAAGRLAKILEMWPEQAHDSKYEKFSEALQAVRSSGGLTKVLVFAFFKDTLSYLQRRLEEEGIGVTVLSGDTPPSERMGIIERFRKDPQLEVLLSSKVGTEGLDFQFCHTLFNYDLPWNPMEVEQRIGRIDRLGQESPVINVVHFWIEGTIEERILKRLYERVDVFRSSIGDLEMILGDIVRELEAEVFSRQLTPEEEKAALERQLLVLDRQREQLKAIESDAARFIGTDMFFENEVQATRTNRRYLTPDQIRHLLEDFIRHNAPRTRLEPVAGGEKWRFYPCQELVNHVVRAGFLSEYRGLGSGTGGREVTFDAEVAFREPDVDFINVLHPLTRTMASFYGRESDPFARCHYVSLPTETAEEGLYFFFVYFVEVAAAKDQYSLEYLVLDDYGEPLSWEDSEYLMGEVLERGEDLNRPAPTFPAEDMKELCDRAERIIGARVSEIRGTTQKSNDLFVNRREGVIDQFYGRILGQRRQRLRDEKGKPVPDERIVRLLEGEIRNRTAERDGEKEKLEARRRVRVEYRLLCAGCLEISNPI